MQSYCFSLRHRPIKRFCEISFCPIILLNAKAGLTKDWNSATVFQKVIFFWMAKIKKAEGLPNMTCALWVPILYLREANTILTQCIQTVADNLKHLLPHFAYSTREAAFVWRLLPAIRAAVYRIYAENGRTAWIAVPLHSSSTYFRFWKRLVAIKRSWALIPHTRYRVLLDERHWLFSQESLNNFLKDWPFTYIERFTRSHTLVLFIDFYAFLPF